MARRTNAEIRQMSIEQAEQYALDHPAESGRIARELARSSAQCAKVQLHYTAHQLFAPNPSAVTVNI